jgi:hypothetical protein
MKTKILFLVIPLILSIGIIPAISFSEQIDSPIKQMANGVPAEEVVCKSGLALMIRPSGDAACVKENSVKKLENRDWNLLKEATMIEETEHKDISCDNGTFPMVSPSDETQCIALNEIEKKVTEKWLPVLEDDNTLTIGVKAYVYGYAPVENYMFRFEEADPSGNISVNQFNHFKEPMGPDWPYGYSPNTDTPYSLGWLDVSEEPIIFHVPDTGDRYYTIQMSDFYTNNFAYVGKRTTGTEEGNFAIVGPNWNGELPNDVSEIESPTNAIFLTGRTYLVDNEDLPNVHAIQEQYTLTPLSQWLENNFEPTPPKKYPPFDDSEPLKFFEMMNLAMTENPPPSSEEELLELFNRINVGPNQTFDIDELDEDTKNDLTQAVEIGKRLVKASSQGIGTIVDGWNINPPNMGRYGDDYLFRAGAVLSGLIWNDPEEATYFTAYVDGEGNQLNSDDNYVLHVDDADKIPTEEFWSVTMYDKETLNLVANEIDRYAITDRTVGLEFNDDGSLDIYLQLEEPEGKVSNWLPTPEGDFYVIFRLYGPSEKVLDGTWSPPPLQKN